MLARLEAPPLASYSGKMEIDFIKRLSRSRAGAVLLIAASATAIFVAGTRVGEFIAYVTGAAG